MILPTSDLLWSQLIHPITSSGISGLGSSPGFIVEGTWCLVTFVMVMQCKNTVIELCSKPVELSDSYKRFL